ncbi:acyl-CoA dehydrogenase family protein [Mycobacterium asiaticum]|uniref:Acyl-CoA dehydrogenase n=1 Tax=Mycobacterium asiaticum TaxID=1790 RepID=A0A1A3CII6_MYCAS|nr:acyl-CoA dehydrogenase family protein [Mycobacterium asiaticum]OBI86760.1 acyl-CoA dehydrogenase [Mycobacterium asiaticum]
MNLELTEEQIALRDTVRRFLAERAPISGHVRALLDEPTGSTEAVWRGLADLGATGLLVPEAAGGAGLSMVDAGIVAEELGAALYPGPWLSTAVGAVRALTRLGGEAASEVLAEIAAGTSVVTGAVMDAGAVSVIERSPHVILKGEIALVPDAAAADTVLVLARDRDDTGLYAVKTADSGLTVTLERGIDPTRKQFRVELDGVSAQRLGTLPADAIRATVDDVLIVMAADALGAARAVMTMAIEHAKTRKQFGQAVGSFQAVQHLCVDMFETVELARSGVIHALWAADAADAGEHHLSAVRAKAFSGRLAAVGDIAIQVFGGIGYTWEHDAHLYLKRLLGWSAFGGGADAYLTEVGAHLAKKEQQ